MAPTHPEEEFLGVLAQLEQRLPGAGPLLQRYDAFRSRFVIPPRAARRDVQGGDRRLPQPHAQAHRAAAGRELHRRVRHQQELERLQLVSRATTGASFRSTPICRSTPTASIDLACHEGYPGHHVYNVLLEKNLVRDRGWLEFSVYPLFSPQSLIAEGTANFGIDVAFPGPSGWISSGA